MAFSLQYRGRCSHPAKANVPAVAVRDLTVIYPGGQRKALDAVSLEVERGTRAALIGPNGAGKSTLLKTIAGLLRPSAGEVTVFGHEIGRCIHQVAYLPQRSAIDWSFPVTVQRLVLSGRYVHTGWLRFTGADDRAKVQQALEQMNIAHLSNRTIGQLSGGQQQRALLARTLVHQADLLLLDEPLNAIDSETRRLIDQLMEELHAEGKTVVMATHDVDRLDADFDRVIAFEDGLRVEAQK